MENPTYDLYKREIIAVIVDIGEQESWYLTTHFPQLIKKYGNVFMDDYDIIEEAIKYNGNCINFASERLQNNDKLLRNALLNTCNLCDIVCINDDTSCLNDWNFMIRILENDFEMNFHYIPEKLLFDERFMYKLVDHFGGDILEYIAFNVEENPKLKEKYLLNKDFVIECIKKTKIDFLDSTLSSIEEELLLNDEFLKEFNKIYTVDINDIKSFSEYYNNPKILEKFKEVK